MRRYSIVDDLIALEEYMERKEELLKKKKETPKKIKEQKLGFFEGLVVAYVAQIMYGPLTKLAMVYFAAHGVH